MGPKVNRKGEIAVQPIDEYLVYGSAVLRVHHRLYVYGGDRMEYSVLGI